MLPATRVGLATDMHEGLQKLLFEQAALFERTDFRREIDHIVACAGLGACLLMLREHADHEDIVVAPILAELDGDLASEAQRQHHALDQRTREVERACTTLRFAPSHEWPAVGSELCRRFGAFVEAQLAHVAFEESELQTLLWRKKSDQELLGMRAAIRPLLTPSRRWAWRALLPSSAGPRVPLVA